MLWDLGDVTAVGGSQFACLCVCGACITATFLLQELTNNYSQVDKLWSVVPMVYAWLMALLPTKPHSSPSNDTRVMLMAAAITVWGVRLTYNFARRGGYTWPPWGGEEDYRWPVLRRRIPNKTLFTLFSFFFVSLFQNILLLLICVPIVVVARNPSPVSIVDWALFVCVVVSVVVEAVADNQQFAFQSKKYALIAKKTVLTGDYAKGFCTSGLFAWCRHPNYLGEQLVWVFIALFSVWAKLNQGVRVATVENVGLLGCVILLALFQGSFRFSEEITAGKYPAYKNYQAQVNPFFPLPPKNRGAGKSA